MTSKHWYHDPILIVKRDDNFGVPRFAADFRWLGKRFDSDERMLHPYEDSYEYDGEPYDLANLSTVNYGASWREPLVYRDCKVTLSRIDGMKRTLQALAKGIERYDNAGQSSASDQALYLAQVCEILGVRSFGYVPDPDVVQRVREHNPDALPSGFRLDNLSNLRTQVEKIMGAIKR